MNSLLDEDTEDDLDDRPVRARDREITLGTTMVLGIFFALAAYGAVLFGFGYSVGVKHLTSTIAPAEPGTGTNFSGFKPAPGSPLGASASPRVPVGEKVTVPETPVAAVAAPQSRPLPAPRAETRPVPAQSSSDPQSGAEPPVPHLTTATPAAPPAAPVAPGPAGAFLVQIAAVSHQEDADLLVVTLKRRGYPVVIRHEPQDALLHVQIGNFVNKKDADAMRQRLLAEGFNAIVK